MKVSTGNSPCHTNIPYILPLIDSLADLDPNAAHVAVHRDEPLAVINQYGIAIKEVVTGGDNDACSR